MCPLDANGKYVPSNIDENKHQFVPNEKDRFPLHLRQFQNAAQFMMHWHGHTELLYFIKGGASIYCGGEEILTEDGDLIVCTANELHRGDFRETGVHYFCIQIPPECFTWPGTQRQYILPKCIRGDAAIGSMCKEIYSVYWGKNNGYKWETMGKVFCLMGYLIRNYSIGSMDEREFIIHTKKLENFNHIIDYIDKNFADPLTTRDMAAWAHMSEYYFCHLFKQSMGVSFISYLNAVRVRKASDLLANSRLSITEVAEKTGFSDVNYFSRVFKQNIGISPRYYREQLSDGVAGSQGQK